MSRYNSRPSRRWPRVFSPWKHTFVCFHRHHNRVDKPLANLPLSRKPRPWGLCGALTARVSHVPLIWVAHTTLWLLDLEIQLDPYILLVIYVVYRKSVWCILSIVVNLFLFGRSTLYASLSYRVWDLLYLTLCCCCFPYRPPPPPPTSGGMWRWTPRATRENPVKYGSSRMYEDAQYNMDPVKKTDSQKHLVRCGNQNHVIVTRKCFLRVYHPSVYVDYAHHKCFILHIENVKSAYDFIRVQLAHGLTNSW